MEPPVSAFVRLVDFRDDDAVPANETPAVEGARLAPVPNLDVTGTENSCTLAGQKSLKSSNWPESAFRQISVLQPTASRGRATLSPTGSTCAFLSLGPAAVFSPWRRSQPHAASRSGR